MSTFLWATGYVLAAPVGFVLAFLMTLLYWTVTDRRGWTERLIARLDQQIDFSYLNHNGGDVLRMVQRRERLLQRLEQQRRLRR